MNLKSIKLPIISAFIILALSGSVFAFLFLKIKSNEKVSEKMRQEWLVEASRREDLKSLEKSISSIDEERALLDSHFSTSSNVVPFLDMIEKLAKDVGAKAEPTLLNLSKDNAALIVQAKAEGSFTSVYKFLTLLENAPYEIEFISMDVQKIANADSKNDKAVWIATLDIKLLSFMK